MPKYKVYYTGETEFEIETDSEHDAREIAYEAMRDSIGSWTFDVLKLED